MNRVRRPVLLLPGIDGSCDAHWQRRWAAAHDDMEVVEQRDWLSPSRAEWVDTLDQAVAATGEDTILVAHSLGCLLVAHWSVVTRQRIRGAVLVAPPSERPPAGNVETLQSRTRGFFPVPRQTLPFPTFLVASRTDPYAGIDQSRAYAVAWGAQFLDVGDVGHINAASGLGIWPFGLEVLQWLASMPGSCRRVA